MTDDVLEFMAEWKPKIRPDGLLETLPRSYRLAPHQRYDISILPRFFSEYDRLWMRELRAEFEKCPHIRSRLHGEDWDMLHDLLDAHRKVLRTTRFAEAYLDTIEDLGLFLLYHEIMPVWIVGCYDAVKNRLLDALEAKALLYGPQEALALQKAVTTMALVDCTQLHRVYNCYDHSLARELNNRRLSFIDFDESQVAPQKAAIHQKSAMGADPDKIPGWEELLRGANDATSRNSTTIVRVRSDPTPGGSRWIPRIE